MIYPEFPKAGSKIGICAPSAGVGGKLLSFDRSIEALKNSGFGVIETANVRSDSCPSARADVRGREFNSLFEREDVDMVLSASGGDYCIEALPYIDRKLLRSNPKWFAGYSDPTSIEMLLTTVLDIATIYGSNAGSFDWLPLHEFQKISLSVLHGDIVDQHSYDFYSSAGFDEEIGSYEMDMPVKWELYKGDGMDLSCMSHLDVSGRLIGGCIDVIDNIIGTGYEDFEGFASRYAVDGLLWYFDNFAMDPLALQYAMTKLKLKGLFENAGAVIFGRVFIPGDHTDDDYLAQLKRVFGEPDIPIIWNADIGHTKPSMTLINGSIGHLSFRDGRAKLSMELI